MAYAAAADVIADLRALSLLEPPRLDEAARLAQQQADPIALVRVLVERRWLTPYQANSLLLGRGAELVLGGYFILTRVGEGGMGQVFKARHRRLGHIVALKLIRKDRLSNPAAVQRFEREIAIACHVEHPNVVRAFDADVANGTKFLAMEFVEGIDLDRLVSDNGPLPIAEACEYARQTAAGLAACHERGLVHRDIKPKNVLLTRSKSGIRNSKSEIPLIKILDLGLARVDSVGQEQAAPRLTQLGKVVGSADYMAPEQGRDSHSVDCRADIYSLGCLLFFLLAGKPPFSGGTKIEKIVSHQLEEAPRLGRVRPEVSAELGAVVRKMLAKHPDDRYQTAAEVIAALDPFIPMAQPAVVMQSGGTEIPVCGQFEQTGMPAPLDFTTTKLAEDFALPRSSEIIVAPRVRSAAIGDRRRALLIGGSMGGVLCAGLVVAILAQGRADPENTNRSGEVQGSPLLSVPAAPVAHFDPPALPLDRKPLHGPPELVAVAGEARQRHWGPVGCVAVSPDSRLIASSGLDHAVRIWDAATGQQRASFPLEGNGVAALAFCADGRLFAAGLAAGKQPEIREWDPASGKIHSRVIPGIDGSDAVDLSPDGRTLAVRYWKRTASGTVGGVQLWNMALDEKGRDLTSKTPISASAWSWDGMSLATATGKAITVWDVGSGRMLSTWAAHDAVVTCLAVSRDGAQVASASTQWSKAKGGEVYVWDVANSKSLATLHTREPVASLAFGSSDILAVGTGQAEVGQIEIHDWAKGRAPNVLKGHGGPVMALAFSSDAGTLASGGSDHSVLIWDVASEKELNPLHHPRGSATAVAIAPDGRSVAALIGSWEPHVRLLDLANGKERDLPAGHRGGIVAVGFTAKGRVSVWGPWGATSWDAANGQVVARLNAPGDTKLWGDLGPDGRTVAAANNRSPTIALWDLLTPAASAPKQWLPGHKGTLTALAFAPDGSTLATAGTDQIVNLWNIAPSTREQTPLLFALTGHRAPIVALAFSSDGRQIASASSDGVVKLYETSSGVERSSLTTTAGVIGSLVFSPDGKTLAGWSHHGLRLWDVASQKEVTAPKFSGVLRSVAISCDGRRLATACQDGQVCIWQIGSAERMIEWRFDGPVHHLAFSADGRHLATANGNGTAYILRATPAQGPIAKASK
jgi:WD40 repeat protein/serine/threonine protein kinase